MPKCDFNKVAKQFIEITFRHGCSPVNLLDILGTPFPMNTSKAASKDVNIKIKYGTISRNTVLFQEIKKSSDTIFIVRFH